MAIIKTATPGTLMQEVSISNKIIEIAEQQSTVAAMATFIPQYGQSEFIVDLSLNPTGILAEMTSVGAVDPTLKVVKFNQKRMASTIEASTMLIDNSAINVAEYCNDLLADRIINGIENQLFNTGDSDGVAGHQNLFLHNSGTTLIEAIQTVTGGASSVYADFVSAFALLAKQPEHLANAVWAIADISAVSAIKDPMNMPILTFDNLVPGSVGRILGLPVYRISGGFSDTKATAVLINPTNAIGVSFAPNAMLKQISGDTTQILRQATVYLSELYCDARVINPRAIVIVKHT